MSKTGATLTTVSPEQTMELAARIALSLEAGDVVALIGDLGTGKTVFVKGLAKGLGYGDYLYVNSPSFVVLKEYHEGVDLYHFDVYRLDRESFCQTLDYEKYFYGGGITVVEWADKILDLLPDEYLKVSFSHEDHAKRKIRIESVGDKFKEIVNTA
ncbi:MAG: tRNA (adenosine(37)-N6)-threonylcarbamoyltransferase complex ATPase subunit type 1 TsaE [Candidatus Omnitrophica bacterium]|nr:tRNA (adenosine(37)-N6)-threonylcarbamoyltransferase complex ATPase subunit type 1 TsaE [Candidatus Omnitrophota bacterium]